MPEEIDRSVTQAYAHALFNVALKQQAIESIARQAQELAQLYQQNARLRFFLEAPTIALSDKQAVLAKLFRDAYAQPIFNLLLVLTAKGRVAYVEPVLLEYHKLLQEHKGIYSGIVITAITLREDQKPPLQKALEKFTGIPLRLSYRAEPQILGGIIFQYQDEVVDASVQEELKRLKTKLREVSLFEE
jgi:F-type H+-transporting ATPase subunit delta